MQVICLRALFSGIGALSVIVPHTPQLRRQLCVIQLTDFGEVQPCVATSSPQRVFMSKHDCVCPAGLVPFSEAGERPVTFSHSTSSRVRTGRTPSSAFIFRAEAFIDANFSCRPSS